MTFKLLLLRIAWAAVRWFIDRWFRKQGAVQPPQRRKSVNSRGWAILAFFVTFVVLLVGTMLMTNTWVLYPTYRTPFLILVVVVSILAGFFAVLAEQNDNLRRTIDDNRRNQNTTLEQLRQEFNDALARERQAAVRQAQAHTDGQYDDAIRQANAYTDQQHEVAIGYTDVQVRQAVRNLQTDLNMVYGRLSRLEEFQQEFQELVRQGEAELQGGTR